MPTYIDLFAGSGGFSLGFDRAGFENLLAVEYDPIICKTYRHNFPTHNLLEIDITKLSNEQILQNIGGRHVDVVIGGPPCQGFSMAGNIGRKFIDDPRNLLFKEFARVVSVVNPTCFVMENVARYIRGYKAKRAVRLLIISRRSDIVSRPRSYALRTTACHRTDIACSLSVYAIMSTHR